MKKITLLPENSCVDLENKERKMPRKKVSASLDIKEISVS